MFKILRNQSGCYESIYIFIIISVVLIIVLLATNFSKYLIFCILLGGFVLVALIVLYLTLRGKG